MGFFQKNAVKTSIVNASASLEDKEGYAVGYDGVLTAANGDYVRGIVSVGRPAGEASEIITRGECEAMVAGTGAAVSAEDPLTGGPNGVLVKATVGTHLIRAIALEANTGAAAKKRVVLY